MDQVRIKSGQILDQVWVKFGPVRIELGKVGSRFWPDKISVRFGKILLRFRVDLGQGWTKLGEVEINFGSGMKSLPISFEKRFRIRPAGLVSKNLIGDWMTP